MKRSPCKLFVALFLLCCWRWGYAQDDNPQRFLQWMKDDPVSMVSDLETKHFFSIVSVGAGLSVISMNDAASSRKMRWHYSQSSFLGFANHWGDWKIVLPVSAGIFGTSMLTDDTRFQDAAFTSMQAILMTKLTVNASKFIFGRERPSQNSSPYNFNFLDAQSTSFPSGHTATAFALVTPWVVYYPGPLTYSLMAIPVGTAIARMARGKHWLSDVTAGAGIGFAMAYHLSKRHLSFQSERVQFTPRVGRNTLSLTVNFSF